MSNTWKVRFGCAARKHGHIYVIGGVVMTIKPNERKLGVHA
jgi:hypothetical protein